MRVLLVFNKGPVQKYLVKLHTEDMIKEIRALINKDRHSDAMEVALSKGMFEMAVSNDSPSSLDADLILSENNARWDLTL